MITINLRATLVNHHHLTKKYPARKFGRPIMKAKIAASLILVATGALASESHFMTPTTDRAQQTQQLLSSAANAVNAGNQPVSDLWVFPTAESDTVFAQYTVKSHSSASKAATSEQ